MIKICYICGIHWVVDGPRNQKMHFVCHKEKCRVKAMLDLAAEDMLTREEAEMLNNFLFKESIICDTKDPKE